MKTQQLHFGLALIATSFAAQATLPTSGAFITDPQSEYVQDQTSEGTSQASKILCYMANTRPDAMVNRGAYIAFIDEPQCATNKADASNSSSEGGGSSVNYTRMRLTSTRASNTSPQIVKGHASVSMGQNNTPAYVYIYASGTEAPSASAPNGVVTMNMGALTVGNINQRIMRGRISATASGIQFSMNQVDGSNYRLYVNGDQNAGSGAINYPISPTSSQTITFGYNATTFCRSDGTTTSCFNRSKAEANTSVWRYGVYNDTSGARYDLDGPGFPVKNTTTGEYGFASYWGIWFPTAVTNGATLQSLASSPTNYTVMKTGGRLTKVTLVSRTLNEVAKVPFNFMPQTNAVVNGDVTLTAYNTYEAYWDSAANNFAITSQVSCGQTGCFKTQVSYTATAAQMNVATTMNGTGFGLNGWSQGLGGNLMIPSSTLAAGSPGTSVVKYNVQSVVMPGDATVPTNLKCARDCPTRSLLNVNLSTTPDQPYNILEVYTAGTKQKGGGTTSDALVSYTWDSTNYTLSDVGVGGGSLTNSLLFNLDGIKRMPPQYMGGIRSGALVDASKWGVNGPMDCASNGLLFCDFKANSETTYYYWENGTNDYQSATFLKAGNTVVAFTPPQSATFDVPYDSTKYGSFAGAKLNLQFMGFGNLGGIPGRCFSPQTNQPASCDSTTRYVPAFSIPENTANSQLGKLTINNATKWVKYLDREIRFNRVSGGPTNTFSLPSGITLGSGLNLPVAMVLTGDADDPSVSSNSNYAGAVTANDFLAAPSVIHGVVQ